MKADRARQPEIDGLRAVAVIAVVLFHSRVPGLKGGFIGVDVFFVISGFLITRLLLDEFSRTGTIRLGEFWARRFRRILPALLVTLALTTIAAHQIQSPWAFDDTVQAARAAAASVANLFFWRLDDGYFSAHTGENPLLHTWSLGVEEQFYLVWPITVLLALRWFGHRGLVVWMSATATASLFVSWSLADSSKAAFYLPQSRMWELAVGAACSLLVGRVASVPHHVRRVAGWAGLGAIALSVHFVSAGRGFPVPAALAPVLGTAAIILAVASPVAGGVHTVLAWKPFSLIGLWSYSWYLLHWPAIVLSRALVGERRLHIDLLASAAALALAVVFWKVVETPFTRRANTARVSTRVVLAVGVCASISTIAVATWVMQSSVVRSAPASISAEELLSELLERPPPTTGDTVGGDTVGDDGAVGVGGEVGDGLEIDWTSAEGLEALAASRALVDWPCVSQTRTLPFEERCGTLSTGRDIMVIGDSHAAEAGLAAAPIAEQLGAGLRVVGFSSCPPLAVHVWINDSLYDECFDWATTLRAEILAHSDEIAAVVWATRSAFYFPGPGFPDGALFEAELGDRDGVLGAARTQELWTEQLRSFAEDLAALGIPLVVIHPSPEFHKWPSNCLATDSVAACSSNRAELEAYRSAAMKAERDAIRGIPTAASIDPFDALCDSAVCPPVMGSEVLYRDGNHLTVAGAQRLIPSLTEALNALWNPST